MRQGGQGEAGRARRGRAGKVRQGMGAGRGRAGQTTHKREEGAHYPICVSVCMKRARERNWGARDERGDAKGVARQVGRPAQRG